jgi:hypothetical protein
MTDDRMTPLAQSIAHLRGGTLVNLLKLLQVKLLLNF